MVYIVQNKCVIIYDILYTMAKAMELETATQPFHQEKNLALVSIIFSEICENSTSKNFVTIVERYIFLRFPKYN